MLPEHPAAPNLLMGEVEEHRKTRSISLFDVQGGALSLLDLFPVLTADQCSFLLKVKVAPSSLCRQAGGSDLIPIAAPAGELATFDLLSDEVTESLLHCGGTRIPFSQHSS